MSDSFQDFKELKTDFEVLFVILLLFRLVFFVIYLFALIECRPRRRDDSPPFRWSG